MSRRPPAPSATVSRNRAPIPGRVTSEAGEVVFTHDQILGGQAAYQKYGLMDWGSVLGHGTYFGPDFTAGYLALCLLAGGGIARALDLNGNQQSDVWEWQFGATGLAAAAAILYELGDM